MKIVLCGFMGCGKSSIGRNLSKILGIEFIDMDRYIEAKEEKTVAEIFASKGETEFRKLETETIKELMEKDNIVIATGGGAVLNPLNVEEFHKGNARIYFLDVPLPALQERLKNDKRRPLLQNGNRREVVENLYNERFSKYLNACDVRIDAGAPSMWLAKRMAEKIKNNEI